MDLRRTGARLALDAANAGRRVLHHADWRLWQKYRHETMLDEPQFLDNMTLVRLVTAPGDIVETGVWRGGMSAAMAEALPGRRSLLFDSFEGLPDVGEHDAGTPREAARDMAVDEAAARAAMARSGGAHQIRRGWFDETIPKYAAESPEIAVLRLDGDLYESTMVCLEHLYPLVVPGGLVIIDDYGGWFTGCTRAVHEYLAREARTEGIRSTRCSVFHLRPGSRPTA
jgi:O-methyltransferase